MKMVLSKTEILDHVRDSQKRTKYNFEYNHVALLAQGNKILATATNRLGSRSKGSGYSARTIHAEKSVIKEVGDITKIRGATLYVIRLNRSEHICGSKPCSECQLFLNKCFTQYGLRRVFYS
jgi:hypothetical protein